MQSSLLSPDNAVLLWAVLFGLSWFAFWSEKFPFGRKITGVSTVLIGGTILSNLRIIPFSAPTYDVVFDFFVPLAIPLLLFQADIGKIVRESGPTLKGFLIGTVFVVVAVIVAAPMLPYDNLRADLSGIFAATYIGGGMNFTAVSNALNFNESSLYAAAIAADNVVTNIFLFMMIVLPGMAFFGRFFNKTDETVAEDDSDEPKVAPPDDGDPNLISATAALTLAFLFVYLGTLAEGFFGWQGTAILTTTAISVAFATFMPRFATTLTGHYMIGTIVLYVFFAALGAAVDIGEMIRLAPILFFYASVVVSVHAVLLIAVARLFKLSMGETVIASLACITGPGTAVAVAVAKGWKDLITPAILVGVLGYAIGTFIGVGLANLLG